MAVAVREIKRQLRARILPDSEGGVPSARTSGGCVMLGAEGYCLIRKAVRSTRTPRILRHPDCVAIAVIEIHWIDGLDKQDKK
jgi:hypothetical protein